MKARRSTAAVVVLLGVAAAAIGQGVQEARVAIEAAYKRENAALAKENVAGVMINYAPDFLYRGPKGETYRAPQLQPVLVQMFASMRGIKNTTRITRFSVFRKEARARVMETLSAAFTPPGRSKAGKLVVVDEREDVWKVTGKGWLKSNSRSFKQKTTLDGKPFQM
jgi:hypothetical protein